MTQHLLSCILFLPLTAGLVALATPNALAKFLRGYAVVIAASVAALSCLLWMDFQPNDQLQFIESIPWLPQWGITYHIGVDGISLPLLMLTTLITPLAILGTRSAHHGTFDTQKEKFFIFLILTLETGMIGSFISFDMFLFYVFWEIVLIPMYFLIGVWGGQERIYAAVKFFIYTIVGSLLMLVAIFTLIQMHYKQVGFYSADYYDLMKISFGGDGSVPPILHALVSPQGLLFLAFALAFAIKVPMFPFHTWLPDAHVQAPTIGSVFLAAVLLKMGTYGLMRFAIPFFPAAAHAFAPVFTALAVVGIIYGALVAMVQTDVKKLVAYSSVSHMGFVVLGLFTFNAQGTAGALFQMINHGIATGGLFLVVGFLYERRHTRELSAFGGLAKVTPLMAIAFMVVMLSSVALPGTNGFVGEFLILMGTYQAQTLAAVLGGTGVILGAVYLLRTYQKVMLGPVTLAENKSLHDLNIAELATMLGLAFFIFGIGFFPQFFFGKSQASLETLTRLVQELRP
jgi:NADH-quinone oxidoreductase subunit M